MTRPGPPSEAEGGRPIAGPVPECDEAVGIPLPDGEDRAAIPIAEGDQPVAIPIAEGDQPVAIPIEDALDLHSFAPRDILGVVTDYLEECARRGMREVRLIHGRGTGTQRAAVQSLLTRLPLVAGFEDAPPERGGWGATVVFLRTDPPAR